MIRGDSITCIGKIDEEIDDKIDWPKIKIPPIKPF